MLLRLAWRNIWRNMRRTILTIAAVAFGLGLFIFHFSLLGAILSDVTSYAVDNHTGHVQIHAAGWNENQTLEFTMDDPAKILDAIKKDQRIRAVAFRVETPGLISQKPENADREGSKEEITSFVIIGGLDPGTEPKVTILQNKIVKGRYLSGDDPTGAIIGYAVAKGIKVEVGDRILLWTLNYYDSLEAKYFYVRGIFNTGTMLIDYNYVFAPLASVRDFLSLDELSTAAVLKLDDVANLNDVAAGLKAKLGAPYEILTWEEIIPTTKQYLSMMTAGCFILWFILLVVVGLGILNTQLMAVLERTREFGVMLSVGSKPREVFLLVFAECLFMTLVGILAGNILGLISVYINSKVPINLSPEVGEGIGANPKIYNALAIKPFLVCSGIIFLIAVVASLWPAVRAARYKPVEALRHV